MQTNPAEIFNPADTAALTVGKNERRFNVRVVMKGSPFGREHCRTHDSNEPMVEFYDATNKDYDEVGQFVSRYYLTTLLGLRHGSGLDLCGYEPLWKLDSLQVAESKAFASETAHKLWYSERASAVAG